jgi:nucleoside-diphosphate-sugar epimerase
MGFHLVTGGAGFIGSHIVEELLTRGERVRVLDNFLTGKRENLAPFLDRIELIEGDIREPAASTTSSTRRRCRPCRGRSRTPFCPTKSV